MLISIAQIDLPAENVRRRPATPAEDAALSDSIRNIGVVSAILLQQTGERYTVIAGSRRLTAAKAAGLESIPAVVDNSFSNGHALAAQAAENLVRVGMDPLDQWRAIVILQERNYSLPAAAACLGLSEREARQLDKLGRLHPDVLAELDSQGEDDWPGFKALGQIAQAPLDVQAAALTKSRKAHDGEAVWWQIAEDCRNAGKRLSAKTALFDVAASGLVWDEDLFAEPGSHEALTTADIPGFMAAQKAVVAEMIANPPKGMPYVAGELDKHGQIKLAKGWERQYVPNPEKPPKGTTSFLAVTPDGQLHRVIAKPIKKPKPEAEAKATTSAKAGKAAATQPVAADSNDDGDLDDEAADAPAPEPTAARPITFAGQQLIAQAKTQALYDRLREVGPTTSTDILLPLLVLALGSHRVEVQGAGPTDWRHLSKMLIPADGVAGLRQDQAGAAAIAALELLLKVVVPASGYGSPHSPDPVPEWIGQAIGADAKLPRFDTLEFLACLSGDELRRAAETAQITPRKTVKALREAMVDKMPDWRPTQALFGAPAPSGATA